MFEKEKSQFIARLNKTEKEALRGYPYGEGCSKEIVPMIEEFFKKLRNSENKWNDTIARHIGCMAEIAKHLACNTHEEESIKGKNMKSIKGIFEELNALYLESLRYRNKTEEEQKELLEKTNCLNEIVRLNMVGNHWSDRDEYNIHDGKIFQSYESLYQVIHKINNEWKGLKERGFSIHTFYDFCDSFKYDRAMGRKKMKQRSLICSWEYWMEL